MFIQHPQIKTKDKSIALSLPTGEFKNIKFTIGRVRFNEVNDQLKISFEYNIVSDKIPLFKKKKFIQEVGKCLTEEIQHRIDNNQDLVYYGGEGEAIYE